MLQLKETNNGKLLVSLGYNVDFLKNQKEVYDNYFDYHKYDLTAVGYFLSNKFISIFCLRVVKKM